MIISNNFNIYNVNKKYKTKAVKSSYQTNKNLDKEDISDIGKDFSFAMQKLHSNDLHREEKIQHIKKEIDDGKYLVDSTKLSRAILFGEFDY